MYKRAIKIFFSYSRKDKEICDRLFNHLKPLEDEGRVELWRDTSSIEAGEQWNPQLQENLETADIILLLVSGYFLGSEFAYPEELPTALERANNKEAVVIPISISEVNWDICPFQHLQALPEDRTPILGVPENEERLLASVSTNITHRVQSCAWDKILEEMRQLKQDNTLAIVHRYITTIEIAHRRQQYSLETYECIVDIFNAMRSALEQNSPLKLILQHAARGGFLNEDNISIGYTPEERAAMDIFGRLYQREVDQPAQPAATPTMPQQPIEVHVVLLALTAAEAEELDSLVAFEEQPTDRLKRNFCNFRDQLEQNFPDWKESYNNTPELWHPLGTRFTEPTSLDMLVKTSLEVAKSKLTTTYGQEISLAKKYQDVRDLHRRGNRKILRELRQDECLIIIDAVSLHHPKIFRAFQRSLLDVHNNTFVVTYAPDQYLLRLVQDMIVSLEFPVSDMGFLYRQEDPDEIPLERNTMPCMATSEERTLKRWLNVQMHHAIDRKSFKNIDPPASVNNFFWQGNESPKQ